MKLLSLSPLALLLVSLSAVLPSSALVGGASNPEAAAPFLAEANRLLVQGSYADAARAFGDALEYDESYVTLYKRATALLSLGRNSAALEDFDHILRINPAFSKAHLEKGKIQVRDGHFEAARASLKAYLKANPNEEVASALMSSVKTAESALKAARKSSKAKRYDACVAEATRVVEVSPGLTEARELRANCYMGLGEIEDAIGDLTRLAAMNPSSPDLAIRVASLSFFLINSSATLPQLKQCLHYDPESKPCKQAHRAFKALAKDITKADNFLSGNAWRPALKILLPLLTSYDETLDKYAAQYVSEPRLRSEPRRKLWSGVCKAYVMVGEAKKAKEFCEETLRMKKDDVDGLVGRGEAQLMEEAYEEAVRTLNQAFEASGRSSQDVANRLQKAQKLLKQSKAKDYYKVIGVSRDADERTIKRAYRQAAKKAHPDKGGSEAKMAALNEAWEVLSKPELKQRYDSGDDPNDQESQRQAPFGHHGGSPFGQGSPFGGGFPGGGGHSFHFQWAG